jgi:AcrR family transcriptional regulator
MARATALTPDRIAEAALRVGDRDGPSAMSMRRIAAELRCDPMALYRHFADREALLDAVADLAMADVPEPDPTAEWGERLRALVTAVRDAALRHPGIAGHVASRPPLGAHGRRLGAVMLAALTEAGLPPAKAVQSMQALIAYAAAALAMAVAAGTRDERWYQVSEVFAALPGAPPGAQPHVVGSADQFAFGLRLLLNGIRAESTGEAGATPGAR